MPWVSYSIGFVTGVLTLGVYLRMQESIKLQRGLRAQYDQAKKDGFSYGPQDED